MVRKKKLPTQIERINVLETTMKQHDILLKDLVKTFNEHIDYSKEWKKGLEEGNAEIKEIHTKINQILNIRVNGREGLEASLRDLYELTKSQRANRRLTNAFKDWLASHGRINAFLSSRVFKILSYITIGWFLFGLLKMLNINVALADLIKILSQLL